jgi:SAM-dependent methyltransferase
LQARGSAGGVEGPASPPAAETGLGGPQLEHARADADSLLREIERLRPGLVRHRALAVGSDSPAFTRALRERFDDCACVADRVEVVAAPSLADRDWARPPLEIPSQLPFADETFDLVHCVTLQSDGAGNRAEAMVAEILRVLRLRGVAVIDEFQQELVEPAEEQSPPPDLEVTISGLDGVSLVAGRCCELAATVTNMARRTLGSAINPLLLESRWNPGSGSASEVALERILLPGESQITTLSVAVPAVPGAYVLELSLVSRTPWDEHRSQPTLVVVEVARSAAGGTRGAIASVQFGPHERVALSVARADGVVLGARSLAAHGAAPRRRYFFARA